jgi:hypothetical protein
MFCWVMMHLSNSAISFSKSSYYCSNPAMVLVNLSTSALYLAMAASSTPVLSAFSYSSLALKVMNKFLIFSMRAESAWTSEELSWVRAAIIGVMWLAILI